MRKKIAGNSREISPAQMRTGVPRLRVVSGEARSVRVDVRRAREAMKQAMKDYAVQRTEETKSLRESPGK